MFPELQVKHSNSCFVKPVVLKYINFQLYKMEKNKNKADSLPAGAKSDVNDLVKIMYKQWENLNGHAKESLKPETNWSP